MFSVYLEPVMFVIVNQRFSVSILMLNVICVLSRCHTSLDQCNGYVDMLMDLLLLLQPQIQT